MCVCARVCVCVTIIRAARAVCQAISRFGCGFGYRMGGGQTSLRCVQPDIFGDKLKVRSEAIEVTVRPLLLQLPPVLFDKASAALQVIPVRTHHERPRLRKQSEK